MLLSGGGLAYRVMTDSDANPSDGAPMGVVVGAYARVDLSAVEAVRDRLRSLEGVELFDLDEPGKVGVLLEAKDLDCAHDRLVRTVGCVPGVLGVWPVSAEFDPNPCVSGVCPSAQDGVTEKDDL